MLDASASERGRTPAMDLQALVEELSMYDSALLEKPALIFANKYDLDGKHSSPMTYCLFPSRHTVIFLVCVQ